MQVVQVPETLFLILTIAVVLGILLQAAVLVGLFFAVKGILAKTETLATNASAKALPVLDQVRLMLEDLAPKVRVVTANVVEVSTTVRDQTKHVNNTVGEVVDKTRSQAARVDEMVSAALDGVTHAATTIQEGVQKPVRRVGGFINDFRSKVEDFRNRKAPASRTSAAYRSTVVAEDLAEEDSSYTGASEL